MQGEPNLSALEAALMLEELARLGVRHVFVAPGSRSSALVVAAVYNPKIDVRIHGDERGAAFRAVGIARGTGQPAAVITTSGTAVANLLPAAVEAATDHVPLVLLTADRPPELHDVGANQAIFQQDIFRPFSRAFANLRPPEAGFSPKALLETVDRLVQAATGHAPGPVQLNVQLRAPLAPSEEPWDRACLDEIAAWIGSDAPLGHVGTPVVELSNVERIVDDLRGAHRPLLVLGSDVSASTATHLAQALGWGTFADVRSGLRLGAPGRSFLPQIDRALEWLRDTGPDVILQLGGRITSKRLRDYLTRQAHRVYILVDPKTPRPDPALHVTRHVPVSPTALAQALTPHGETLRSPVPEVWTYANALVASALIAAIDDDGDDTASEPWVARWLSLHVQRNHGFFLSGSMPIRDVQSFAVVEGPWLTTSANRGASGIDGIVSTALGFAEGPGRPVTLLIGDLALLHDVNALAAVAASDAQLIVVVLNNGGGSIFSFLPIAEHEDVFSPWFDTPHEISFEGISASFGLTYARVTKRAEFERAYQDAVSSRRSTVIEVVSGQATNRECHRRIEALIDEALS